jgi:hypothetical protein
LEELENAMDVVKEFHKVYPKQPKDARVDE